MLLIDMFIGWKRLYENVYLNQIKCDYLCVPFAALLFTFLNNNPVVLFSCRLFRERDDRL